MRPAGPIPASAGEPDRPYPLPFRPGAYPRERGGTRRAERASFTAAGLSPRARGNQRMPTSRPPWKRPIPASAGEPVTTSVLVLLDGAYPRERGGTHCPARYFCTYSGLSPRARGNLRRRPRASPRPGPIPASAGEPHLACRLRCATRAYPRERGGTALVGRLGLDGEGLSPRARGNLAWACESAESMRPIPASAGEPDTLADIDAARKAYPRERGGTPAESFPNLSRQGLSPRARGNRISGCRDHGRGRPIPASAGEP